MDIPSGLQHVICIQDSVSTLDLEEKELIKIFEMVSLKTFATNKQYIATDRLQNGIDS